LAREHPARSSRLDLAISQIFGHKIFYSRQLVNLAGSIALTIIESCMKRSVVWPLGYGLVFFFTLACGGKSEQTGGNQSLAGDSTAYYIEEAKIQKEKKRLYKADAAKPDTLGTHLAVLDLSFPVAKQWADSAAMLAFNLLVDGIVSQEVAQYQRDGGIGQDASPQPDTVILPKDQAKMYVPGSPAYNTGLRIGYRIVQKTDKLIAVEFGVNKFLGGAHDDKRFHTLNFDLANRKALALKDLFDPSTNYMQLVANYCRQELLKRRDQIGSDSAQIASGTSPDSLRFFANFELKPDGIEFLFNPYQVAPYASGEQRVLVPRNTLGPTLVPGPWWDK
jgi:hypothetical protein